MRHRDKVAVSISRDLLAEVERMRKESGDSRSAVFERALIAYLATADQSAKAQRYMAAYRRLPERVGEQRAALATALTALSAEPWDA